MTALIESDSRGLSMADLISIVIEQVPGMCVRY